MKNLNSFDVPVLNYTGDDSHQREPFQISEDVCFLEPFSFVSVEGILVIFFFFFPSLLFIVYYFNRCELLVSTPDLTKFLMLPWLLQRF